MLCFICLPDGTQTDFCCFFMFFISMVMALLDALLIWSTLVVELSSEELSMSWGCWDWLCLALLILGKKLLPRLFSWVMLLKLLWLYLLFEFLYDMLSRLTFSLRAFLAPVKLCSAVRRLVSPSCKSLVTTRDFMTFLSLVGEFLMKFLSLVRVGEF